MTLHQATSDLALSGVGVAYCFDELDILQVNVSLYVGQRTAGYFAVSRVIWSPCLSFPLTENTAWFLSMTIIIIPEYLHRIACLGIARCSQGQ